VSDDVAYLHSWIGRQQVSRAKIDAELVRRYRATLDLPDIDSIVAPRLLHFCLAPAVVQTSALGTDGHPPLGDFLPPVPLPRRMWAGGKISFEGDLSVGDNVRRVSRVENIAMKEGRTGRLFFVTVSHHLEAPSALIVEQQDIVYRGPEMAGASQAATPAAMPSPAPTHQRSCLPVGPTLLFRYSALTFNAHRIHYDRPYAIEEEGYPDLVVHGPLQAAMLINYATELSGTAPSKFSFRGTSPLYSSDSYTLNASVEGETMKLWTEKANGTVCMAAIASW